MRTSGCAPSFHLPPFPCSVVGTAERQQCQLVSREAGSRTVSLSLWFGSPMVQLQATVLQRLLGQVFWALSRLLWGATRHLEHRTFWSSTPRMPQLRLKLLFFFFGFLKGEAGLTNPPSLVLMTSGCVLFIPFTTLLRSSFSFLQPLPQGKGRLRSMFFPWLGAF